jgi:hypothetical protein
VTFVLGNPPEDSSLPVPWPYALPDGWSMEWDPSPAKSDHTGDVMPGLSMMSILAMCIVVVF